MFAYSRLSWPAFWCGGYILSYQYSKLILLLSLLLFNSPGLAQENFESSWNGNWIAEGTLFSINVVVLDNEVEVKQIESLGFEWTSSNGKLVDNLVTVQVEYAGVTGIIQAELIDEETAIVAAQSCIPEFMLVCALANNRQVLFRKISLNN